MQYVASSVYVQYAASSVNKGKMYVEALPSTNEVQFEEKILTKTNYEGKTAAEVLTITHEAQLKESRDWLNFVANSFSVVCTLIVTVAYMASSTVPGGSNNTGYPVLQSYSNFQMFTLASLIAFIFGIAAIITFLGILIRPNRIWDFEKAIPLKLIFGFTCSIISLGAMVVSFCGGNIFTLDGQLRSNAFVLYGALCIPVPLSIWWLSSLYTSLLVATFSRVPCVG